MPLKKLEELKVFYLGKNGILTLLLKSLQSLPKDQKINAGKSLNIIKKEVDQLFISKKNEIENKILDAKLIEEKIDISLPERPFKKGGIHPLTKTLHELISLLANMGFEVKEGPHIEDDYNNFTALNISENHPARQDHDTFYINQEKKLLRTHTSPVQIRVMKEKKLPIKMIAPGTTYRCDDDSTHSPMFHQIEGLVVDKMSTMADLKATIQELLKGFFQMEKIPIRFRPSYFPFTEPSAEVDIGCSKKKSTLEIGKGNEWLEVLGCGMVNVKVLDNCGINSNEYRGYAFGLGVERFAMLKYGINDLRMFYDNDLRWLKHFSFRANGFPSIIRGLK